MDNVYELSIEETNKLRERLGLKKLEIKEDNTKKRGDEKPNFINEKWNEENKKLKKKDEDIEKKRKINNKKRDLEGNNIVKSISDDFNDDVNDVESWINKTRDVIDKKLAQEAIEYSDDEEEKEIKKIKKKKKKNNFVSNLKVEHKNEDITDDMILTLKDKNVLDEEEEDCLINEELKKQDKKHLIHKKDDSYWNKNYYDPLSYYDDNNKNIKNNELSLNMLPKYDDEKYSFDVSIQYEVDKNNLDNEMSKKKEVLKEISNLEETENGKTNQKGEEINDINYALKMKKRKIKNIKRRKKEDVWDFLYNDNEKEETREGAINEERGNGIIDNEREEKNQSTDIINDVIKKIREEQMNMDSNYFDGMLSENEEDKELYELLQKGKDFKKIKKENKYQNELLKYMVINDERKISTDEKNNNSIKLTNTSEFCKNISLPVDLYENENNLTMKRNRKNETIPHQLNEKNHTNEDFLLSKNILKENINENVLKNRFEDEEDDEESQIEEQDEKKIKKLCDDEHYDKISEGGVSKIFNEVELDEGLFGALEYLKTKGELNIEDKIYKNPENKPLHMSTEKNDIKLDYKNESGKVMTPKETFRYMSWIFHGKKQGKNKLEKKIKRLETERRFKENPMDSLPTLNVLKKYQQIQKKSYFTLSSNN